MTSNADTRSVATMSQCAASISNTSRTLPRYTSGRLVIGVSTVSSNIVSAPAALPGTIPEAGGAIVGRVRSKGSDSGRSGAPLSRALRRLYSLASPRRGAPGGPSMARSSSAPLVGVVMGSDSDWPVMRAAVDVLERFEVAHEARVVSAHRMPDALFDYAASARARGLRCIVAGAGGAAHLPGMLAAKTPVPVLGVPVPSRHLAGLDSLYSIVQMPRGIPVATFAIGEAGAVNAALFAVAMLAAGDAVLAARLDDYRAEQSAKAEAMVLPPAEGA